MDITPPHRAHASGRSHRARAIGTDVEQAMDASSAKARGGRRSPHAQRSTGTPSARIVIAPRVASAVRRTRSKERDPHLGHTVCDPAPTSSVTNARSPAWPSVSRAETTEQALLELLEAGFLVAGLLDALFEVTELFDEPTADVLEEQRDPHGHDQREDDRKHPCDDPGHRHAATVVDLPGLLPADDPEDQCRDSPDGADQPDERDEADQQRQDPDDQGGDGGAVAAS
jgi:hypothetical protein